MYRIYEREMVLEIPLDAVEDPISDPLALTECPQDTLIDLCSNPPVKHEMNMDLSEFLKSDQNDCKFQPPLTSGVIILKEEQEPTAMLQSLTNLTPYKCGYCGYKTATGNDLEKHMSSHSLNESCMCKLCNHQIPLDQILSHYEDQHPKKHFACALCDYETKNPQYFENHLMHHSEGLLDCESDKSTSMNSNSDCVTEHKTEDPIEYSCFACSFKTLQRDVLIKHVDIHSEEKQKLECNVCGYKTMYKGHLQRHMRSHESFVCTWCGYKTVRRCRFKNHLKRHHKNAPQEEETDS